MWFKSEFTTLGPHKLTESVIHNRSCDTSMPLCIVLKSSSITSKIWYYLACFIMICTGDFLTICSRYETFLGHYDNLRKILSLIGPMAYLVFKKQTRFIEIKEVHLGHRWTSLPNSWFRKCLVNILDQKLRFPSSVLNKIFRNCW